MNTRILLVIALLSLTSCTTLDQVTPRGERMSLRVHGRDLTMELLFFGDSVIYVQPSYSTAVMNQTAPTGIYSVGYESVENLEIEDIANKDWIYGVIFMEVLPAVLMGAAAASYGDGEGFLPVTGALLLPAALNTLLFVAGTPETPSVNYGVSRERCLKLQRYARFPQGLPPEQLHTLLIIHSQEEALSLEFALSRRPAIQP